MKGLYIHIPFCVKKCDYCDFVSFPGMEAKHEEYISALCAELEGYKNTEADTVFIGGGTPTAISAALLKRVICAVRDNFAVSPDAEFTVEVNPGTIDEDKLRVLLNGGVNRVSVGVQSFNDRELQAVGRIHSAREAYSAVEQLSAAGFSNISIDLMMSLPYQTRESFERTLDTAVSLPIKHISVYSLIIEDGTPIVKKYEDGTFTVPDENEDRELYHFTAGFLALRGFYRYEISNYAMSGFESRHNLKYWDCAEYIGAGLAAHSFTGGVRRYNTSSMDEYLRGNYRGGSETLSAEDMRGEYMMLGLRKTEGVSDTEFRERFGAGLYELYGGVIEKFADAGAVEYKNGFLRLTGRGLDIANTVMCEFV